MKTLINTDLGRRLAAVGYHLFSGNDDRTVSWAKFTTAPIGGGGCVGRFATRKQVIEYTEQVELNRLMEEKCFA